MGEKDPARSFAHHLENPLWLAVLKPDRILADVEIGGGDWAEIGSGSVVFTFPLARLAQQVHALDADTRMVEPLGERVRNGNVGNVKAFVACRALSTGPDRHEWEVR